MLPAGQDAAEAFYRITDAAYERRSVAVTSNIHPSKAHMFERTCVRRRRKWMGSGCCVAGLSWRGCQGTVPGFAGVSCPS